MLLSVKVSASPDLNYGAGYMPYTYNFLGNPIATPVAFEPYRTITGYELGGIPFKDLSDITFDGVDTMYLADSGNNRVIITDSKFKEFKAVSKYQFKGAEVNFNNPTGVVSVNGRIYISDSQNGRIVVLDETTLETKDVFEKPVVSVLGNSYSYVPIKIAVDYAGRIYIIAKGINKGLMQLSKTGEFESFIGAPKVSLSLQDMLFRKIFSKSMREKLIKSVPTEYNALSIDQEGFIYVTSQSTNISPIGRLNGQGTDVLKFAYKHPDGDQGYLDLSNQTVSTLFVDIIPRKDGGYYALDANKGRVFAYDQQGVLLYLFGSIGSQSGSFYAPTALEYIDNSIIVVDKSLNNINIFHLSNFGNSVNDAIKLHEKGAYKEEKTAWENVLRLCSNYDIAYINLAKIDIMEGNYKPAMQSLASVGEKKNYAVAFKKNRIEIIKKWFNWIVFGLVLLIILLITYFKLIKKMRWYKNFSDILFIKELKYSLYTIIHPFDGFWDIKREKRGSMRVAVTFFVIFTVLYGVRARYSGYLFMIKPYSKVNVLISISSIMIPILLWVVSNWCFTTLMDGKGTLKDIFISTGYSLVPYILFSPLLLLMSHVMTIEEGAFYTYFDGVIWIWVLILMFFGMMMTHDYSLGKSMLTLLLTIVGICLILFIILLFSNLINEIYIYIYNIYKEISFRFY